MNYVRKYWATGGTSALPFPQGQSTNVCVHAPVFPDPESEAKPESTTKIDKQPITVLNKEMVMYTPCSDHPAPTMTGTKAIQIIQHQPPSSPCQLLNISFSSLRFLSLPTTIIDKQPIIVLNRVMVMHTPVNIARRPPRLGPKCSATNSLPPFVNSSIFLSVCSVSWCYPLEMYEAL
ncbi:hypothetical protein E2C01_075394 [Portunus trituberculatus]|uniref:Uncharacterized protein n=1 Tax=Portunus trituberculatus TaxID=210409 RepID=A0A5B7I5Z3_PORTR|nr:hypothetical protein [Portunus trituberculatus]